MMATKEQQPQLDFFPFAYSLFNECLAEHCWYCLDEEKKHKRCTGCQRAFFCDKNCQTLAWKDHKFECRGIRAQGGKVPDIEVRLLGRIVARHKAILCGVDKKDANFYKDRTSKRNIMDIWAHTKNIEKDEYAMGKFEAIYERLCQFYDPKAMLNKEIVFQLHCRDFINRHAISDRHYLREIGKGLYLDLCAYDHSCRPNTIYSCRSFIATLRPLSPQVNLLDRSATFYSYIDLLCAKQDRRKLLKDTWYFNCECDRCADESEHILTSMICPNCQKAERPQKEMCIFGQPEYKDPQSQLITCPQCQKTLEKEQVMEAISAMRFINDVKRGKGGGEWLKILSKTNLDKMKRKEAAQFLEDLLHKFSQLLPPSNVYLCKIVQALLPRVDQNDSSILLNLHLMVEKCIRICYPQNHPALAFHLRNIGIFAKCVGNWKIAKKYLDEAKEMFNFVMGPGHSLMTVTKEILEKLEEEKGNESTEIGKENEEKKEEEMEENNKAGNGNGEFGNEDEEVNGGESRKEEKKKKNKRKQKGKEENGRKEREDGDLEKKNGGPNLETQIPILNLPEMKLGNDGTEEENGKEGEMETKGGTIIKLELPILEVEIADEGEAVEKQKDNDGQQELSLQIGKLTPTTTETMGGDLNQNQPNEGGGNSPGGVKKKLQSKKISPRARTPMYPKLKNEEGKNGEGIEEEKGIERNEEMGKKGEGKCGVGKGESGEDDKNGDKPLNKDIEDGLERSEKEDKIDDDNNEGEWQQQKKNRKSRKCK